ncbi:hypothetical protein NC653_008159 [Populus alba x Populus x berolinensis]|uniref:EF-hand domain-containing protein n=1 Tax=Populus alba x Populus x berolinensis TaxID=444605 RepID=A0AAD6R5R2_9ROSI|nr:hypothetical protein NC653_008159 [Populus alba x Populus x berolinensis]
MMKRRAEFLLEFPIWDSMGTASSMLTQYDLEEVQLHCHNLFSQQEIVSLYQRFCQLDRNAKGFISADEFLSVPEFAMNPLSQRLLKMLDGLNFKDFVAFLSAFSAKANMEQKITLIFKVYDSDGNGKISFNDILEVLQDLSGVFMSNEQREKVLLQVLKEAGYTRESYLMLDDFIKGLDSRYCAPLLASLTLTFSCKKSEGRSRSMFSVFSSMETVSGNKQWSSDQLGAGNLHALQKLGGILHCNKMQIAALELQSFSSPKNLSFSKLLESPASIRKHRAGDGLRFLDEIGKDFRGTDAMEEQRREMFRLMNGKNLLTESRASSSNELVEISPKNSSRVKACSDSSKGKQLKQVSEAGKIKQLSKRLKTLEEETEPMKQEFFQHMEERKKLVAEIHQQFQTIHHFLQFENQELEEGSPDDGPSIVEFLKKAGLGLAGQESYTDRHQDHALSEEDMERLIRWLQETADAESERVAFKKWMRGLSN